MIAAKQTAYLMSRALPSCTLLVLLNIGLILFLPANTSTMSAYHLSDFEYRIISFAIALPSFIVWFVAFVAYAKLQQYANSIRNTREGKHYQMLARGAVWLAWSLPLSRITTTLLGAVDNEWASFHSSSILLGNYLSLVLPFIAFSMIAVAVHGLVRDAGFKLSPPSIKWIMAAFAVAGASYCLLVFQNIDATSLGDSNNAYYLPVWLLVTTIMLPYLYMWFVGMLAACELALLSTKLKGLVYKRSLAYLIAGLVTVLVGSIVIQYIGSAQPRSGHLLLNAKLAITLIFRVIQGLGFALIVIGATKLKKIEEV